MSITLLQASDEQRSLAAPLPSDELSLAALVQRILQAPTEEAQRFMIEQPLCTISDTQVNELAQQLKDGADRLMHSVVDGVLQLARLLQFIGERRPSSAARALGLVAEANARAMGGLGEYREALTLYDQAIAIYEGLGRHVDQARTGIGKIYALTLLGRYDEALAIGRRITPIFEAHHAWLLLAGLNWNLAIVYGRQGEDRKALEKFDEVRAFYIGWGAEGESFLPLIDLNRVVVLRNLGHFNAAIEAGEYALDAFRCSGQYADVARAQQNLGFTYLSLGRYTDALARLEEAGRIFLDDGRIADALGVELYVTDCLLELRRFADVLRHTEHICTAFAITTAPFEIGQALLNAAVAHAGLNDYAAALATLTQAERIFATEGSAVWLASVELERAAILYYQGDFAESLRGSTAALLVFQAHALPVREAQVAIIAGRAALALGQSTAAHSWAARARAISEANQVAVLAYQSHALMGALYRHQLDPIMARVAYRRAIHALEQLRGNTMVEFRAAFLEDKQIIYEEMVDLCLALDEPVEGFAYAERAKSRALLDLISHRANLRIDPQDEQDQRQVDRLMTLRQERNRLYRHWEAQGRERLPRPIALTDAVNGQRAGAEMLAIEAQITELWHKLLVRNANYARANDLWSLAVDPTTPVTLSATLAADQALVEYFIVHGTLIAFVITSTRIDAVRLPVTVQQVVQLSRLWQLNLTTVLRMGMEDGGTDGSTSFDHASSTSTMGQRGAIRAQQQQDLQRNADGLLQQLYQELLAPVRAYCGNCRRLIVVPHGPLHYLPFHAFYDGERYLFETVEVSYLPGANLLRHCCTRATETSSPVDGNTPSPATAATTVVFGHSYQGKLRYVLAEAATVAQVTNGRVFTEDEATLACCREETAAAAILHFATHGQFRADNPLFSGLALADGWLTTLDIFHLRLHASLVTLSACQTGRHVVGGGDELLGLMRAFLYAGAASLVATLWSVEDQSTALLMHDFYHHLVGGATKGAALRQAQLAFIRDNGAHAHSAYRHPAYWAPFFLIGHDGVL